MKPKPTNKTPSKLHVNILLEGDEVARFLSYKAGAYLRNNSEAGRKLMLERLHQVETQKAEPATS